MGIVYATQYQLTPASNESPMKIYERLINKILTWSDYAIHRQIDRRLPPGSPILRFDPVPAEGGRVDPFPGFSIEVAVAAATTGDRIWRMVYIIPDDKQDHLQWIATASVTLVGSEVEFDFSLDVKPTSFIVVPRGIHPGTPGLIREILGEFDCRAGGVPLRAEPIVLHEKDIPQFVHEILPAPNRLPIILISADFTRLPDRSEAQIALETVGLAHVFYLENTSSEDLMISELGGKREFACFGGGVRTYWPGFSEQATDVRDPMISSESISNLGAEVFARRLRQSLTRLSAANYENGATYKKVKREIESEHKKLLNQRISNLQTRSENFEEAQTKNRELADLLGQSEQNRQILEETIRAQEDRIKGLEAQIREQVYSGAGHEGEGTDGDRFDTDSPAWPLPWKVENPNHTLLITAPSFVDGLRLLEKDGNLKIDFDSKLRAVLFDPEGYGKWLRGARKGQKCAYVANNYRLVWTPVDGGVRLELFCSKEDRRYSPFGA